MDDLLWQRREYEPEKYGITVTLVGRRERWREMRRRRVHRILARYLHWRLRRLYPESVVERYVSMIGGLAPWETSVGAYVRVVRRVSPQDRDVVQRWLDSDVTVHSHRLVVPVLPSPDEWVRYISRVN